MTFPANVRSGSRTHESLGLVFEKWADAWSKLPVMTVSVGRSGLLIVVG